MSSNKKIALIIAAVCAGIGCLAILTTFLLIQFDFKRLNTMKFEEKTYEVTESFHKISINDLECDVKFIPTESGPCRVVCFESSKIGNQVSVEEDTLVVTRQDKRPWYEHFGIWWNENNTVTVYLPKKEYESLHVKTLSGGITIADSFAFQEARLVSTSGDIAFTGRTSGNLYVKTTSGDINVNSIETKMTEIRSTSGDISLTGYTGGDLYVKSTSGDIRLGGIEAKMAEIRSTSGDLSLSQMGASGLMLKTISGTIKSEQTTSEGHAEMITTSGDISLYETDADTFDIKSTSGDVRGTLLTGKIFETRTSSGSVHTPPSKEGAGKCNINTTSGDIRIDIVT